MSRIEFEWVPFIGLGLMFDKESIRFPLLIIVFLPFCVVGLSFGKARIEKEDNRSGGSR